MVQATFHLTEKDLYEAQVRHWGVVSRMFQILGVCFLLFSFLAIVTWIRFHSIQSWGFLIPGPILLLWPRLMAKVAFNREPKYKTEQTYQLSDDGIEMRTADSQSKTGWAAFVRFAETKNLFMIYPQRQLFYLVPKRVLSPEDVVVVRALLQQRLSDKPVASKARTLSRIVLWVVILSAVVLVYLAVRKPG